MWTREALEQQQAAAASTLACQQQCQLTSASLEVKRCALPLSGAVETLSAICWIRMRIVVAWREPLSPAAAASIGQPFHLVDYVTLNGLRWERRFSVAALQPTRHRRSFLFYVEAIRSARSLGNYGGGDDWDDV